MIALNESVCLTFSPRGHKTLGGMTGRGTFCVRLALHARCLIVCEDFHTSVHGGIYIYMIFSKKRQVLKDSRRPGSVELTTAVIEIQTMAL